AWTGVGWALVACAGLTALLLRDGPRGESDELRAAASDADAVRAFTLVEALRSPAFWAYALTSALYLLVASATSLLNELMLRERGVGADTFRAGLATTALVGILANFVGGFLGTKWPLPRLLAISTLLLAPCVAAYPLISAPWHAVLWAAGMGASGGI